MRCTVGHTRWHARQAPELCSSARSLDTSLDAAPSASPPSRSGGAPAPDGYGTAWSGQMSYCHTHTAPGAARGSSWEEQAPDDGPDGPVSHPLSEACGCAGEASCTANLMTVAGGKSWN